MATVTGSQSDEWIKRTENIWDPGREKEKNRIIKEKRNRIVNCENENKQWLKRNRIGSC